MSNAPSDPIKDLQGWLGACRAQWAYFVAFGVALMALGLLAAGLVVSATLASVFAIGILMIATGIIELAIGFGARDWGRLALWSLSGLLYAAAGVVTVSKPGMAAAVFTLMLGAGFAATGALRLFISFQLPADGPRGFAFLSSLATIAFGGVVLLGWPADSLFVLGTILSVDLLFAGIGWLWLGLALRAHDVA